jgi:hypothetical protein
MRWPAMDEWNLVVSAVAALAAVGALGFSWSAKREKARDESPDVSGGSSGNQGSNVMVDATIMNPSRRVIRLVSVEVEQPDGVRILDSGRPEQKIVINRTIDPFGSAGYCHRISHPFGDKSFALLLKYVIEVPFGGKLVSRTLNVKTAGK